jgi:nicotinamidase/pyrazinamidase
MKTVFFDIDTQIDFLYPAGALYVPGAERLLPLISRLNQQAEIVVSTMCAHGENDAEFTQWPPHCVLGTSGQLKPQSTLLADRSVIGDRLLGDITLARQIILEKQQLNPFTNPNLSRLLDALEADDYVVYGVVTEYCVGYAALGLLDTGKPVTLLTDAIQSLNNEDASRTLQDFTARGGKLATSSKLLPSF